MRISRQSIDRRISLADLLSKARIQRSPNSNATTPPSRWFHRLIFAASASALLFIHHTFQPHHIDNTNQRELLSFTPPSVPLLRSNSQNEFNFFEDVSSYKPTLTTPTPQSDVAFTIFYNLYIPTSKDGSRYASSVLVEQLSQIATALTNLESNSKGRKKSHLVKHKRGIVYYNLIGKLVRAERIQEFCHGLHPRLTCGMIGYFERASEGVTLQALFDYCSSTTTDADEMSTADSPTNSDNINNKDTNNGDENVSDQRVTYLHSKGSYHNTPVNTHWRRELTSSVLHPSCLSPPNDACNVCGTSFFTRFAFMFPGNMWTARCSYVRQLLPPGGPSAGGEAGGYEDKKKRSIVSFLKYRLYGVLSTTLLEDRIDYFGLGRYSLEHWIGSHPSIKPCELHRSNVTLGDIVGGIVTAGDYEWGMGPRRTAVVPEIDGRADQLERSEEEGFREYYLLVGNLIKWFTLYGSRGVPRDDSWVWTFFSGGEQWKKLVERDGVEAVDRLVERETKERYSGYEDGVGIFDDFNKVKVGENDVKPVVVFYHIAYPKDQKKEAQYSVKVQLDVLSKGQYDIQTRSFHHERPTIVYYSIANGDESNAEFIHKYCNRKKQNTTCHLLNEIPSVNSRGETLVQLYNYCKVHPSSRVTYITNQHPPNFGSNATGRTPMQKLRAHTTAVTSKMCLRSRDTCNVCGMEFYALPYLHFSGNSFTADCEYVNKLIPPRQFEVSMNALADDTLIAHLERSFTTNLFSFTPQNLGLDHFSIEHWISSHPDIKPCDVAPVKKSWLPWFRGNAYVANDYSSSRTYDFQWGVAPRRSHAPVGTLPAYKEKEVKESDGNLFREYFYLAGNLYKWKGLYGKAPPVDSWVWNWFPGGETWKEGYAEDGLDVVDNFMSKYAEANQGVPF